MIERALQDELLHNLNLLDKREQDRVLLFVKTLLNQSEPSKSGLMQLAGAMDKESIRQISNAIQSGCENIEQDGW